jgi:hypothetical protein
VLLSVLAGNASVRVHSRCCFSRHRHRSLLLPPRTTPHRPGAGKTAATRRIIHDLRGAGKVVRVCSLTAVAAALVGGDTIHSAFGIPPHRPRGMNYESWKSVTPAARVAAVRRFWRSADVVVLDEIGTCPAWMLRWICDLLCDARGVCAAFGGTYLSVEVVWCSRCGFLRSDRRARFSHAASMLFVALPALLLTDTVGKQGFKSSYVHRLLLLLLLLLFLLDVCPRHAAPTASRRRRDAASHIRSHSPGTHLSSHSLCGRLV